MPDGEVSHGTARLRSSTSPLMNERGRSIWRRRSVATHAPAPSRRSSFVNVDHDTAIIPDEHYDFATMADIVCPDERELRCEEMRPVFCACRFAIWLRSFC